MRAAVLTEVNKPLQILDLEQEAPKANEVRVQVKAAGVCMSDWHIMNGDWPLPLPMVLGHEAAGIVVENGPGATAVKPGDHVIFSFRPHCGRKEKITWSPGLTFATPAPTSSTMPAASWPRTMGRGNGQSPFMMCQSLWQTPAAFTRTRASPACGPCCSRSTISSGLFGSYRTAAFIS